MYVVCLFSYLLLFIIILGGPVPLLKRRGRKPKLEKSLLLQQRASKEPLRLGDNLQMFV